MKKIFKILVLTPLLVFANSCSNETSIDTLDEFCRENLPTCAILCIPATEAEEICNTLIPLGVKGFWNFSHYDLAVNHPEIAVENVHLGDSLMKLSYKIKNTIGGNTSWEERQFDNMPAIAAILFMVAYNMSEWKKFVRIAKTAPKSDILILVVTFVLTVVFDLVVAIAVGMVLAAMLFLKRMSDETSVNGWKYIDPDTDKDSIDLKVVPKDVRVYEISGPLFFGVADKIPEIILKDYTRCLILRMRAVPSLDSTALNALEHLYEKCQKQGVKLILSHVNEQPMQAMKKSGLYDAVGEENFCLHIDEALKKAENIKA